MDPASLPKSYLTADTETTGFGDGDRVCELAIAHVVDGKIVFEFATLIDPEREISADAHAANGLVWPSDFVNAPKFVDVVEEIGELLGLGLPVVAHNAPFDRRMLRREHENAGVALSPDLVWIDTCQIARKTLKAHGQIADCKQTTVAAHFGVDTTGAHRALADARALHRIVERLRDWRPPVVAPQAATVSRAPPPKPANNAERLARQAAAFPSPAPAAHLAAAPSSLDALACVKAPPEFAPTPARAVDFVPDLSEIVDLAAFDPSAFTKAAKGAFDAFVAVVRVACDVGAPAVDNEAEAVRAVEQMAFLADVGKECEKLRKRLLDPLGLPKSDVEAYVRDKITKPAKALADKIASNRETWILRERQAQERERQAAIDEQTRIAQEAASAAHAAQLAQAEIAQARADTTASPDAAAAWQDAANAHRDEAAIDSVRAYDAAAAQVVVPAPAPIATKTIARGGSSTDVRYFEIRVLDAARVPDRYTRRVVDEDAILAFVRQTGGAVAVPGVEIVERVSQAVRRAPPSRR